MSTEKTVSIKRAWLVPKENANLFDDQILLEFSAGMIAAHYEAQLSFEEEEYLMKVLREENTLIGEVFFDGMPLESFIGIMRKARMIEQLNSKIAETRDEEFKTILFDRTCTLWDQILEEESKAIKNSLKMMRFY